MTTASNSGHPTSCSSMAEIMSVLFYRVMRYSVKEPKHPSNDRFVRLRLFKIYSANIFAKYFSP